MRNIIGVDDYYKIKSKLYIKARDQKNISFEEYYSAYLTTKLSLRKGNATATELKKKKHKVESFEPISIDFIHVKRFLNKNGRLLHKLENETKIVKKPYNSFLPENLKDKLLNENSTTKIYNIMNQFDNLNIDVAISIIDNDAVKSKRISRLNNILNSIGIIGIALAIVGIFLTLYRIVETIL